jgi:predicted RNA-binding Zn ribbon-like protein
MPATATPARRAPPFKYVGGDASVDFVNTVDWTARGLTNERLIDYESLIGWAEGAGVLSVDDAARLRDAARHRPGTARQVVERARRLRRLVKQIFDGFATGQPNRRAIEAFNRQLSEALPWLRIAVSPRARDGGAAADWIWGVSPARLDAVLWPILWTTAVLLTSSDSERIKGCASPDCGWMFVDRSRNGLRRWCAMDTCGTLEKTQRRRERLAGARSR